jgi:hypothetical protein
VGAGALRFVGSRLSSPLLGEGNETPSLYQQNKELVMSQQSNFDFNAFNNLVEHKPAGLQIFLAQQLLSNALWSMEKYDNVRQTEVRDLFNAIKSLRVTLKADAVARN